MFLRQNIFSKLALIHPEILTLKISSLLQSCRIITQISWRKSSIYYIKSGFSYTTATKGSEYLTCAIELDFSLFSQEEKPNMRLLIGFVPGISQDGNSREFPDFSGNFPRNKKLTGFPGNSRDFLAFPVSWEMKNPGNSKP